MAQIVAGFGVPHTPIFPHFVKRDGPDCEIARLFRAQKEQLAETRPDVIVMFDTDHLNTFFLDSLPIFAVGIDRTFRAPNDEPRDVPDYALMAGVPARRIGWMSEAGHKLVSDGAMDDAPGHERLRCPETGTLYQRIGENVTRLENA